MQPFKISDEVIICQFTQFANYHIDWIIDFYYWMYLARLLSVAYYYGQNKPEIILWWDCSSCNTNQSPDDETPEICVVITALSPE